MLSDVKVHGITPLPESARGWREHAEAHLMERSSTLPETSENLSPEFTRKMLHELQIHQIALELQNEELRRTQSALCASRARYFEFYDMAPVGYCSISEQEIILKANLTAASLLGVARSELVGQPFSRFIFKDDTDNFHLHSKRLAVTGEPLACELRMFRKDGTTFWAQLNATVIEEADGMPVFYMMLSDVTQRKETEIALAQERFLLHALMSTLPEHIYFKDRDSRIIRISQSLAKMFSLNDPEKAVGKTDFNYFTEEHARQAFNDEQEIICSGQAMTMIEKETWPGHSDTWVSTSKAPLRDERGNIVGTIGISKDITAHKLAEIELEQHRNHLEFVVHLRTNELAQALDAAEAANRAKSTFLTHMSHELRTPLNSIMGMTSLALRQATDPQQINSLTKSVAASKHLLALISDILDISRIEAGRVILEERDFSLTQMIDDTLQMQEEQAQAKGLSLYREVAPALPELLHGDGLRLKQILLNFIANAIKFSEHGQIIVRATIENEDAHSLLLLIEVTDQGIGISPEQQTSLFDAFTQIDQSSPRKYGGAGLGLSIAKRLAMLMGGDIGVISQVGNGSTFWATARLQRAMANQQPENNAATEPRELLAQHFSGLRVLVADDDPMTQEVAMLLLKEAGLLVELACNGQEAVEKAQKGDFALILMDMQMPIMNGLDATEAIRKLPGMASIPILAMTASAFDEDRQRCLAVGMNAHIGKPVDPDVLCATVLIWLQNSTKPQ